MGESKIIRWNDRTQERENQLNKHAFFKRPHPQHMEEVLSRGTEPELELQQCQRWNPCLCSDLSRCSQILNPVCHGGNFLNKYFLKDTFLVKTASKTDVTMKRSSQQLQFNFATILPDQGIKESQSLTENNGYPVGGNINRKTAWKFPQK